VTLTYKVLEARNVSKRYGQTRAIDDVSITLAPGEVHGLVGHNGAGKSTLLRMLSGAERPDSGDLLLDGQRLQLGSPGEAIEKGVSCVYQELSILENLTVAQNLFLGRELRHLRILLDTSVMNDEAVAYLEEFGLAVSPTAKVRDLTVAQRQLIEVITAMHRNARFLLLDEPTSALGAKQIEELLATIRRIADARGIGVLLVDHKLDEVYAVADRVTALRNGAVVLSGPTEQVARGDVVGVIVGGEAGRGARAGAAQSELSAPAQQTRARPAAGTDPAPIAVEVRGLTSEALNGVSLVARGGRVLGVYGLVGSGRSDLLRALYGVDRVTGGEILLFGTPYRPSTAKDAIAAGLAFLSEDRKGEGFVPKLTPITNVTLPVLARFSRLGALLLGRAADAARESLASVEVRGNVDAPMEDLSGGNQQKVLFGRVVLQRPRILLLDEPTKGVDIGAKAEIQAIVRSLAAGSDVAAIVVSSEEEEILAVSDDIVVFRNRTCDGTIYHPDELGVGDLRRLAWTSDQAPLPAAS